MNRSQQLKSIAYIDGPSIKEIEAMDLTFEERLELAGYCAQYAYGSTDHDVYQAYCDRAQCLRWSAFRINITTAFTRALFP